MARPVLNYVSAAVLGLIGFAVAGGCAESESMLVIRGVIAMEAPECVASADTDAFYVAGALDPRLTTSYAANLQVASQLTAQGDPDKLRAETARVSITGAEVKLKSPSGSLLPGGNYTVTASGSIDPAQGGQAGLGVVFAPLVPDLSQYVTEGDEESLNPLIVEIQVFGSTVGGQDVWSNWFTYPIYFQDLVYFPSDAMDDAGENCTATSSEDPPCRIGQDELVPCSACLDMSFCTSPTASGG